MKWWPFGLLAGIALVAFSRREVRDAGGSAVESIVESVAGVYFATTQDSRYNEERFASTIADAEALEGIPRGLLHRLLYQESRFRSDIISGRTTSGAGAIGIAQIVPKHHPTVDPYDPLASIYYAAGYLAQNFRRFGSWQLALAAYNAGPGNVAKYGGIPPFDETQKYVAQITADVEVG